MTANQIKQTFDVRLMIQLATVLLAVSATWFAQSLRVAILEERDKRRGQELQKMETAVERLQAKTVESSDRLIRLEVQLTDINRKLDKLLGYQVNR